MDQEKVQLETMVREFLRPIKNQPFAVIIKALSGHEVVRFDKNNLADATLLQQLEQAIDKAAHTANEIGIYAGRPNEAGNAIEPFVLQALIDSGLKAAKPKTKSGKGKSTGYPDVEVVYDQEKTCYLECKTYSAKSRTSTNRSFFLSPSADSKITRDGHHLLIAFELERDSQRDRGATLAFRPVSWHIYTLHGLLVDLKYEFNAGNDRLYKAQALLSEGTV